MSNLEVWEEISSGLLLPRALSTWSTRIWTTTATLVATATGSMWSAWRASECLVRTKSNPVYSGQIGNAIAQQLLSPEHTPEEETL